MIHIPAVVFSSWWPVYNSVCSCVDRSLSIGSIHTIRGQVSFALMTAVFRRYLYRLLSPWWLRCYISDCYIRPLKTAMLCQWLLYSPPDDCGVMPVTVILAPWWLRCYISDCYIRPLMTAMLCQWVLYSPLMTAVLCQWLLYSPPDDDSVISATRPDDCCL